MLRNRIAIDPAPLRGKIQMLRGMSVESQSASKRMKIILEYLLSRNRLVQRLRDGRVALGLVCRVLCFSLLAGWLLGGVAAAANVSGGAVPESRSGSPFAIADFDGDSRLDFASVETGHSDFANTEYWIRLRLNTAGWESIRLVAPSGGLQLTARDVNGDESVDLVVSTAWSNRPVAIYLNDGHGAFTHAEPGAFPEAFSDAASIWTSGGNLAADIAVVPSVPGAGVCADEKALVYERSASGSISPSSAGFPNCPLLFLQAGRAPPFAVSHF